MSPRTKIVIAIIGLVNSSGEITTEAKMQHGRRVLHISIAGSAASQRDSTSYWCQTAAFYVSFNEHFSLSGYSPLQALWRGGRFFSLLYKEILISKAVVRPNDRKVTPTDVGVPRHTSKLQESYIYIYIAQYPILPLGQVVRYLITPTSRFVSHPMG